MNEWERKRESESGCVISLSINPHAARLVNKHIKYAFSTQKMIKNKRCLMCDDSNWKLLCQTCVSSVVLQIPFWIHQHACARIVFDALVKGAIVQTVNVLIVKLIENILHDTFFLRYDFSFDDVRCGDTFWKMTRINILCRIAHVMRPQENFLIRMRCSNYNQLIELKV